MNSHDTAFVSFLQLHIAICMYTVQGALKKFEFVSLEKLIFGLSHFASAIPQNYLLEIEKEIVHEVARGDQRSLRKSAGRKAQINLPGGKNVFSDLCARSADFLRWCLSPRAISRKIFFLYFQ